MSSLTAADCIIVLVSFLVPLCALITCRLIIKYLHSQVTLLGIPAQPKYVISDSYASNSMHLGM